MKRQNSQKTENSLKVCPEKVYQEKYVTFPITNKGHFVKRYLPLLKFEIL